MTMKKYICWMAAGLVMAASVFGNEPPAKKHKKGTAHAHKKAEAAAQGNASSDITRLIAQYPPLTVDDDTTRALNDKYADFARMMTPATAKGMVKLMRSKLADDVKYWSGEASRPPIVFKKPPLKKGRKGKKPTPDPHAMKVWEERQAAQVKKEARAKDIQQWLTVTLPGWLSQVDKAAP